MNSKKMFMSFIPWLVFSVIVQRHGTNAAGIAALAAAMLGAWFAVKDKGSLKIIDATGIAVFGAMAAVAFVGGTSVDANVADFGRGGASIVLALVMLGSVLIVPFTEQYARESVPREYWNSPTFHAVNRRISAVWGAAVLVMGLGHLLAGHLDPASAPVSGARPIDLLLNWGLPVVLVLLATEYTKKTAAAGPARPSQRLTENANAR
ncbi:MAG: putative rane protein [Pseudonocardiales bacterium]|nr:putative rane protein [Pseudonocardiales bacterium]